MTVGTQSPDERRPRIVRLDSVDSTNAEAMRQLAAGETGPLWIVADKQTAGRGRCGRTWSSQPGNLLASYLTVLAGSQPRAYQISLVAGVAVAETIRSVISPTAPGLDLRLKWPNDVLIRQKDRPGHWAKAGGILVESTQSIAVDLAVVIGIGLNLVSNPEEYARATSHFAAFGPVPDPGLVLSELDRQLKRWLTAWDGGRGFAGIRQAWLELSCPQGERISVNAGHGPLEGTFCGLDANGALILTDDAGIQHTISYGDVTLVS